MKRKDFRKSFDALTFSSDFSDRTRELLYTHLPAERKEQTMKPKAISKKTKIILLAAALILAFGVTVGAAVVRFVLPKEAEDFLSLEELRLTEILDGAPTDVSGVTAVKQSVKTEGHTITFAAIVEGQRLINDVTGIMKAAVGAEALPNTTMYAPETRFAVLTVVNDRGGPVLGYETWQEATIHLGASLAVQGIDPSVFGFHVRAIGVGDTLYLFIPLTKAEMYADRELRIFVYGKEAPDAGTFTFDEDTGLADFRADCDGIKAVFTIDLDDSLADPEKVKAFEAIEPRLPTDWEIRHGLG